MRRRFLAITMLTVVATLGATSPQLASSAPSQDPRAEREAVRAERARVAAGIDTSKASLSEIDAALLTLEENLRTQQTALARTEEQVAQAEADIADANVAITKLTEEASLLTEEMTRRAIDSYVNPIGDDVISVLDTKDFTTASNRKFYIELRAQDDADISDRLEGAGTDLDYQRRKATEAKATAEQKRAEQQRRTDDVAAAEADQQQLANSLQATIDSQIARSISLASTDRALSAKIAEQQAALVARLAAQKAAAEEAAARKVAAAKKQQQARPTSTASSAAASAPAPSAPTTTTPPPSNQGPSGEETEPLPPVSTGGGGTGTGGVRLCTVGGITVNCAIAGSVESMLNAARADGVSLSGGGYRDPSGQIALRRKHCGTSSYAIYQMPASQCRPPTARPGTSQHELGLAIDFRSCNGGSSCYRWLRGNASRFGFYNLPGEPWHWSTSGR